jgi:hypothetical protein
VPYKHSLILVIFLLPFVLYSCSDSPTSIGKDLLGQDGLNVLSLNSTTDSTYQKSSFYKITLPLAASDRLLLGKHANTESSILIRFVFTFADSIRQDILNNSINVSSAFIEFIKNYQFGDSTAAFDYQGFNISTYWSVKFDADSLSSLVYDPNNVIQNTDIVDSLYRIHLSNQLALDWLTANADTNTPPDEGLYIQPTSNSDKAVGFYAVSVNNINQIPLLKIVVNKSGSFSNDTLTYIPGADICIVQGPLPVIGNEDIAVQGGVVVRSKIYFDLSKIPPNSRINSAKITLQVDSTQTIGALPLVLNLFIFKDSTTNVLDSTLLYQIPLNGNIYSGSILKYVQKWIRGNNEGMMITTSGELSILDLTTLSGSGAVDISKRPKLEVVYTNKN